MEPVDKEIFESDERRKEREHELKLAHLNYKSERNIIVVTVVIILLIVAVLLGFGSCVYSLNRTCVENGGNSDGVGTCSFEQ